MFDSIVLDVVVSLVFIYLLYSLLATILGEIFSSTVNLRARILWLSINRMLQDDNSGKVSWWKKMDAPSYSKDPFWFFVVKVLLWMLYLVYGLFYFVLIKAPYWLIMFDKRHDNSLAEKFFETPGIKYLSKNKYFGKPGYISADMFSTTVINLLRKKRSAPTIMQEIRIGLESQQFTPKCETKKHLSLLIENAAGNVDEFKRSLEDWYNETQDRATGWYKKRMQLVLFIIGLGLAIGFNVDTIKISKTLMNNHDLAHKIADKATDSTTVEKLKNTMVQYHGADSLKQAKKDSVDKANLDAQYKSAKEINKILGLGKPQDSFTKEDWWLVLIGWIVTALAISLGAPFWFDLLNKLMALRGSGKNTDAEKEKKEESTFKPIAANLGADPNGFHLSGHAVKDPIWFALSQHASYLKNIPGVIAVNKDYKLQTLNGQKSKVPCIEVRYLKTCDISLIPAFVDIDFNNTKKRVPVEKRLSEYSTPHQNGASTVSIDAIAITNESNKGTNNWGTLTGIVQGAAKKKYALGCAHVMKGNNTDNELNGNRNILKKAVVSPIATLSFYVHTNVFDIGWAELGAKSNLDIPDLYIRSPRVIAPTDADALMPVVMSGAVSGVQTGILWNDNANCVFQYPQGQVEMFNLLKLTYIDSANKFNRLSQGGDSGAIVEDTNGRPVGIVIGADNEFTYAIKLSDVFNSFKSIGPINS